MSAKFNFGDIVSAIGYWPQVFKIDGYRIENYNYPGEKYSETVYELSDVHNYDWIEADEEDLKLVAPAHKAEEYLANNPAPAPLNTENSTDWSKIAKGAFSMAKQERQPTARELSAKAAEENKAARKAKAEEIDNLLDRRNFYADQFAQNGDVEDNEKVLRIDAELKALAEAD